MGNLHMWQLYEFVRAETRLTVYCPAQVAKKKTSGPERKISHPDRKLLKLLNSFSEAGFLAKQVCGDLSFCKVSAPELHYAGKSIRAKIFQGADFWRFFKIFKIDVKSTRTEVRVIANGFFVIHYLISAIHNTGDGRK